jgi:hypothetical protein
MLRPSLISRLRDLEKMLDEFCVEAANTNVGRLDPPPSVTLGYHACSELRDLVGEAIDQINRRP